MIYKLQKGNALPSLQSIQRLRKRGEPQEDAWKAEKQRVDKEVQKINNTRTWRSKTADVLHNVGVGATGLGLLGSFIAAPAATALGLVGGIAGEQAVNKITKKITGKTWNEQVQDKFGIGPTLAAMTNPGGLIGGTTGAKAASITVPKGILGINLPFKQKFSNPKGKIWSQEDIISFIKQHKKTFSKADIENFMTDNNLQPIILPNGKPGFLEVEEGAINKGIESFLNAKPIKSAEGRISSLESLNVPRSYAGKQGYTLDSRNGQRYLYTDLFNPDKTLKGGQNAFYRMRSSFSGQHGTANWKPQNETQEVEAIMRNHFNGNPGETAIDAYTGKDVLNPDGSKRIMSPIEAITYENPSKVSGTYSNAVNSEFSLDSYLILLAKLRRAHANGMRMQRSRYNTIHDGSEVPYSDLVTLNGYGTKSRFNVKLDPEYKSLIKEHYKDSHLSRKIKGLPEGTSVTKNGNNYTLSYNGKDVGTIEENNLQGIFDKLTQAVKTFNNDLRLKGTDALPFPEFDGVIKVPNPQFIIYNKGGKFEVKL